MKSLVKDESQDIILKRKNKKTFNKEKTNKIKEINNLSTGKKLSENN